MNWLHRLFHKSRSEDQLDKELRFHLEQQVAGYIAAGISPEEARRRARLEFGGLERVKEEVRDTRWETHLDNLARDFRYALRTLRKDRRFALTAIFALALGIGASTVVFSVVYNVFFQALPYQNYNRSSLPCTIQEESASKRLAGTSLPRRFAPFANKIMCLKKSLLTLASAQSMTTASPFVFSPSVRRYLQIRLTT